MNNSSSSSSDNIIKDCKLELFERLLVVAIYNYDKNKENIYLGLIDYVAAAPTDRKQLVKLKILAIDAKRQLTTTNSEFIHLYKEEIFEFNEEYYYLLNLIK